MELYQLIVERERGMREADVVVVQVEALYDLVQLLVVQLCVAHVHV